jgi:hypothetical protein
VQFLVLSCADVDKSVRYRRFGNGVRMAREEIKETLSGGNDRRTSIHRAAFLKNRSASH